MARIFAISGSNVPPEVAGAADGFLLKPFNAEGLSKLLEGNQPEAALRCSIPMSPWSAWRFSPSCAKSCPSPQCGKFTPRSSPISAGGLKRWEPRSPKATHAEIRRIGHAIKGGCGMAGALQAARLGALLRRRRSTSKDNQLDNSAVLLSDLRAAAQGLERMLDAELPA
jgi:hypothetical protein